MFVKNFYYYYTKLFSDQFCDYVIRKGKELVEQDGKVGSSGKGKKDNKIRDSKITWIKDRDILEPVLQTIEAANRKAEWDFHLDLNLGITAQFTKYGLNQFYHWHRDCDISNRNRKLSFILNLSEPSDYQGGHLEFDFKNQGGKGRFEKMTVAREKGSCIIFPSFMFHRVRPVKKGTRYSLVVWVTGPNWR